MFELLLLFYRNCMCTSLYIFIYTTVEESIIRAECITVCYGDLPNALD